MNQSFYTAAVGAWQQQERLNVHGNNIANVNNYGFKAKKPSFAALMYDFIAGAQADELPRGTGTYMVGADTDFGSTGFADTGLDLDYAIEGTAFSLCGILPAGSIPTPGTAPLPRPNFMWRGLWIRTPESLPRKQNGICQTATGALSWDVTAG